MMESRSASPTAFGILQRLSRGMQALLLIVVAMAALGLLWWASATTDPELRNFLNAVGTGLLTSAAFGVAQAFVTGRVTSELLRTSVVAEVSSSLARTNSDFFPTHDFVAHSSPDPVFNALITRDLNESASMWFQGISGRYTAAKLALNKSVNLQAHIILPDPRVDSSLDGRVDYAYRHNLYPDLSIERIREKTLEDLIVGIVGLFAARHRCASLELILTPRLPLDRFEMFRDSIWVTLFTDPGQGTKFPRTLRFGSASVVYRMNEAEFLQTKSHPTSRLIQLSRRQDDSKLCEVLEDIQGKPCTPAAAAELLAKFEAFAETYRRELNLGRAA